MAGASAGGAAAGGRAAAKKTAAKKTATPRKTAAKRAPAKKTAAKKTAAKKAATPRKTAAKKTVAAPSTDETTASTPAAAPSTDETTASTPAESKEPEEGEEAPQRDYVGDVLGHQATQTGAGIILGIVGYALLVNYLKSGPAGVRTWFRAKFLNHDSRPVDFRPPPGSGLILGTVPMGAGGAVGKGVTK